MTVASTPSRTPPATGPGPEGRPTWQTEPTSLHQRAAMFWLNLLFFCSARAPWVPRVTVGFWVWATWTFSAAVREATLANAARLLGPDSTFEQRRRLARRVIRNFFLFVQEIGSSARLSPEQLRARTVATEGTEHYDAARRLGRGVIIATAHLGCYEVGIAELAAREPRVHVVFQHDRMPLFNRLRHALHQKLSVIEAPVDNGLRIWADLRDALERNEAVLLQADRVMPGQRGVRVPICGADVELPLGPVKLARYTGAPILPVFSLVEPGGGVRIVIEPAIHVDPAELPSRHHACSAQKRLAAVLEKQITRHPDQWLVLYKAWCEDRGA